MPQIIPIKELKNTNGISEMCHNSKEPIFVTKNGYGDMVFMSMDTYEELFRKLELYKETAISEKQYQEGKYKDARLVLSEIEKKYDL